MNVKKSAAFVLCDAAVNLSFSIIPKRRRNDHEKMKRYRN